jgi:Tfp pilus assembly protein PilO
VNERKRWIVLVAVSALCVIGLGTLIYYQRQHLDEDRQAADALRVEIKKSRELVAATPELEKEVILQRETDEVIREILSDDEDVNNLVRTLQRFAVETDISISSVKKAKDTNRQKGKADFTRVAYTLNFDADAFQLLEFMNRVEGHSRFMSITSFKLDAARRKSYEDERGPIHSVVMDLETYVYIPKGTGKEVKIDGYDRKADLLVSEIGERADALRVPTYHYAGPRGRRDPWIDPRVPVIPGRDMLSIEDQITRVDDLAGLARDAENSWREMDMADNLISEMKARATLESQLADLEEEARRTEESGLIVFAPARKRLERDVLDIAADLRERLVQSQGTRGPSIDSLREAAESMENHLAAAEYELALEAFQALEPNLALVENDELKRPLVDALRRLEQKARTVLDFEQIDLGIAGVAVDSTRTPVALIAGRPVSEGELVTELTGPLTGDELLVQAIRQNEIDFVYRGLVITRRFDPSSFGSSRESDGAKSGKSRTNIQ